MMLARWAIVWLLVVFAGYNYGMYHFKNVECIAVDPSFIKFPYCFIKAVNRTYKYLSLKVELLQKPVSNVTVQFAYEKRANGYKPFLIKTTFDMCKFLKTRDKDPLKKFIYSFLAHHSNINHSCPYNHDIVLEKLDVAYVTEKVTKLLPFPSGDYRFFTSWQIHGIERVQVIVYGHVD